MSGALAHIRVVEFANKGGVAHAAALLGDMGADVIRIDRMPGSSHASQTERDWRRGRRSVSVDLNDERGMELVRKLLRTADVALESYRPGALERRGLGAEASMHANPRLVFGRLSGWGRQSEAAGRPGHDINYVAASGALACLGRAGQPPTVPLNLLGDGAGGMLLALGVVAALVEREASGRGQIVDASMVDAATSLMTRIYAGFADGSWHEARGANYIDSGAPFYEVYACLDGRYLAVGAIEPQFFGALLEGLAIDPEEFGDQWDRAEWPRQKQRLSEVFRRRSRDEWSAHFADRGACVSPVLSLSEAPAHPLNRSNGTFAEWEGQEMPAPVPRFGRTPGEIRHVRVPRGRDTDSALADWGVSHADIRSLRQYGVIG